MLHKQETKHKQKGTTMRYPIAGPSDIPGSGSAIYQYLLENIQIPSRMPHEIWYNGQKQNWTIPTMPLKDSIRLEKPLRLTMLEQG